MNIYIMRHGQAEMIAPSDSARPLTAIGKKQSAKMAKYLSEKKVTFDAVLVSPYLRAQKTLEAVTPFFPKVENIQTLKSLTPSGSARASVNEILALQADGAKSVLIVSHLPLVGYIVGELAPAAGVPSFSTSSVAHIDFDEQGFGTLLSLTAVSNI